MRRVGTMNTTSNAGKRHTSTEMNIWVHKKQWIKTNPSEINSRMNTVTLNLWWRDTSNHRKILAKVEIPQEGEIKNQTVVSDCHLSMTTSHLKQVSKWIQWWWTSFKDLWISTKRLRKECSNKMNLKIQIHTRNKSKITHSTSRE